MFTFEHAINLPLIWGGILAIGVLMYVLLDGFDLGVGILFPFAPGHKERDLMMHSMAPFWDGNETWLVLGGGGLFAAFPLAYAIVFPAMYVPIILMLLCLIFRGVAFEFRFKADKSRFLWDHAFHFGSLGATFMQGMILGGYIQGIHVEGRAFAGGPFDWLTPFSMLTGMALVFGYVLLGATWLVMKTDGHLQQWAREAARYSLMLVAVFMGLVTLWVPFLNEQLYARWFTWPNMFYLSPLPILSSISFVLIWKSLRVDAHYKPFLYAAGLFVLGYIGLALSLWPWVVPYQVTLADAAAAGPSLSLLLIGVGVLLPIVLANTAYCYYTFRGKAVHDETY